MGGYIGGNGGVTQVDGYSKTEVDSKVADKVEDSKVLTDVPANAVFTDTTYSIRDGELSQNNFTNADHTKLDGIEASADVTDTANVVAALTAGTNITIAADGTITSTDTNTTYSIQDGELSQNNFTDADHTKLNGIETAATADQTDAEIKTAYENNSNTNAFTDADHSKLDGIETGATADQTKADIDALNVDADTLDGQHGAYYTAYADTAVSNLVDSSPAALNTLNELAAALGDDANFSTTMTNALAGKVDDSQVLTNVPSGALFTDTNTTYSVGDGGLTQKNFTSTLKTKLDGISANARTGTIVETGTTFNGTYPAYFRIGANNAYSHPNITFTGSTSTLNTGNIAVTGTVDGRDVATDGTKLDTIATNANNYSFPYTVSASRSNSTVVQRNSNGYIYANFLNTTANDVTSGVTKVMVETGNDDFIRHGSAAAVRSFLNVANGATNVTNNNQLTNGAGYITSFTNTTYSAGSGLGLSGTTFSVDADLRGLVTQIGRDTNDYYLVGSTTHKWYLDGNEDMRLENDGDLHVDGNVVAYSTTTSDERLKKDIVKIDNALDKVGQLNGYTFEYLNDGKKSAGILAQEVEAVLPSAVSEMKLPLKSDDDQEYKVVQYDQLHGLLIEAIKELKAEIEELKAR
jgi:hypothetical protein